MGVAAFQALSAGGGATYDGATFAGAWFSATTYAQWLYRMVARNALVATFHRFLGGVLAPEVRVAPAIHPRTGVAAVTCARTPAAWRPTVLARTVHRRRSRAMRRTL
jgi:hypothetical protein